MRSIAKVFGYSPFGPLQKHMNKVAECVGQLPEAFEAYEQKDVEAVEALAKRISKLEHEADLVKNEIRNNLPRGLFMPVDRARLLQILAIQDNIADRAENIAILLTFKQAKTLEPLKNKFDAFVDKNLVAFETARRIIDQIDELLESGFGGSEAARVNEMADEVAFREHEADKLQRDLVRELLQHEDELTYGDFFMWERLIRQVSEISDEAENLANAVRLTLVMK